MTEISDRQGLVGYVPGAWDMFHIGHLNILRRARENCDWLVAGVVTDDALFQMKGKYPIIPFEERLAIVEAIGLVDEAVVDHSQNKLEVWERVHFDVLFKGDDWRGTAKGARLERDLVAVGARVEYFPYTLHTSSTELRRVLAEW
ncbi:MAG: cytidyltransferase [Actinobacteria bacterium HGW-Actinobacteria-5]|jgi:glycerol-3-phosphate cytidylyltransferase|nr:MAG: cytidyltransferase [Actinobacteria bacterium HGW-Actinobacteria-5]